MTVVCAGKSLRNALCNSNPSCGSLETSHLSLETLRCTLRHPQDTTRCCMQRPWDSCIVLQLPHDVLFHVTRLLCVRLRLRCFLRTGKYEKTDNTKLIHNPGQNFLQNPHIKCSGRPTPFCSFQYVKRVVQKPFLKLVFDLVSLRCFKSHPLIREHWKTTTLTFVAQI